MNKIKIYPFADIHKEVIRNFDKYKINILQGAVRSGKTYLANMLLLKKLEYKKGKVVISGFSSNTTKKNIIQDLGDILDIEIITRNNAKGEYFTIPIPKYAGLTFYVVGGGKEGDEKKIQGMTVLMWYADEAATYAKSFFDMMLTRLSREDSKAIFTLNPEGPSHYLKKFIDEQQDSSSPTYVKGFLKSYRFKIDDNTSLQPEYIQEMKNTMSGHTYRRLILGEWAAGDGLVYSVDKLKKISKKEFKEIYDEAQMELRYGDKEEKHTLGVDLGTTHPTSFIKCWKYEDKWYIVKEYYKPKIPPSDIAIDLNEFNMQTRKNKFEDNKIFYDHAAGWFFSQMKKDFPNVLMSTSKKEVLKGLMFIESLILSGKLIIVEDECPNLLNEFNSYSWDEKSKGDSVIKENDDAIDALRYAIYSADYQSAFY